MTKTMRIFLPVLSLAAAAMILTAGCGQNSGNGKVAKLKIISGSNQYTLPGREFAKDLVINAEGPSERGFFGSSSSRPATNAKLKIVLPENSVLSVTPMTINTDLGGAARFKVTAGNKVGDHYFTIVPESNPDQAITAHYTIGAQITGGDQEVNVSSIAPKPLSVKLVRHNGTPADDVPVYFKVISSPVSGTAGATVSPEAAKTDSKGEIQTIVKTGKASGEYIIGVEIADPADNYFMRQIQVRILALDVWKVVINVLGALALFVFGMKLMSDGLMKIAGDRMKKILQFFSRNGIVAVCAGAAVTAVVQSSSATTVMVIGFINAGLLNITQAIGIIFGANIGTTVTAQIISFNLSGLALPSIAVGFFLTLSKKRMVNAWGTVFLGFGMLFFGMQMMSSELKLLGEMASFRMFFNIFDCSPVSGSAFMPLGSVIGAAIIGLVMTMILQSSSAFTGIVLALAAGQLVNFYTAVPLLIGSNIGTTVTAQLGALSANRVAKQAALAHTLFNVFGALIVTVVCYIPYKGYPSFLYLVNSFTPGNAFAEVPQNLERHIAMFHTIFNIAVSLLLLPFVKQFAMLCSWIIPVRDKVQNQLLEPALLNTPSVALKLTSRALEEMVTGAWDMVNKAVLNHFLTGDTDEKKYEELVEAESNIDKMQSDVTSYLVQLTRRRLVEPQSEMIPLLMHCTNDAERIADHCEIILQLNDRMVKQEKKLSDTARNDLQKLWNNVAEISQQVVSGLAGHEQFSDVILEQRLHRIHALADQLEAEHIERLRNGSCTAACGVIYIEVLGEIVKIADRLANIAERSPEIRKHYVNL